jgi:hypothetical protein
LAATRNNRHLARSPIDHSKRLLEETCLNYAYPIRHKLKGSFLTSGSLTWGAELGECNTLIFIRI